MDNMRPEDIVGQGWETFLTFHDGTSRWVITTDREVAFPEGELIVSQTDTLGRIIRCNPAFVHMSGYSPQELLGQSHHIVRHPDMPRAAFAGLWSTIQQGQRWSGYVKNLRKDGAFYWVFATVIPMVRQGRIVGYTSVRRAPARRKVEEAEATYVDLLRAEQTAKAPRTGARR
ncbi:MAG TPA: PAS domain-containing protein [Kineosporiaceae bacterium]|nr:PAS domain-containing protein [Kineosporiaceae bacterium]